MPEQYDDGGFTGANTERPAFQKLLSDIDAGKIDIVLVYKVDRLSRSLLDFAKVMDRFNQKGIAFVSVTQKFSTADAMGRLTLNMLMSFAEFEREMIGERTRDKIAAARRKGKWTGGQVPLGYDVQDKKLVINDLEAVVVHEIFDLYDQHQSALAVAKELNNKGRRTKSYQARNGRTSGNQKWGKDAVLRILKNGVYAGYMPYGDELHEAEHEAIIDRERFMKIGSLLDGNKKNGHRHGNNPDCLLRGILRCQCNAAMTPASTRKKGKVYRYYRCVQRDKKGTKVCDVRQIPAQAIEDFVVDRIREAALGGKLAQKVGKSFQAAIDGKRKSLDIERRDLPQEIAKLSDTGRRLVDKVTEMDGVASKLLEDRINQVGSRLGQAESRLMQVERGLAELDRIEAETKWVTQAIEHFDAVWETMTPMNRIRLVGVLVKSVRINEKDDTVTATLTDICLPEIKVNAVSPPRMKPSGATMEASL